ncbi:translation initiation factor IF-2-like [Zalophus californianus]|uniref:Translation initiation factor IF-2-like n=1 Tax=Zalophus californianus TaxID=9704 RepID=A0A6J2DHF3_ZALCA|nr:translation initiation factor IF-2-like [Zalophus californianus]
MFLLPGGEGLASAAEGGPLQKQPRKGRGAEDSRRRPLRARAEKRKRGRDDKDSRRRFPGPIGCQRPDPSELRRVAGSGAGVPSSRACRRTLSRRRPLGPWSRRRGPTPYAAAAAAASASSAPPPPGLLPRGPRHLPAAQARARRAPLPSATCGLGAGGEGGWGASFRGGGVGEREPVRGRLRSRESGRRVSLGRWGRPGGQVGR